MTRRLDQRPEDDWGWRPEERELILRLHHTKEEIPKVGTIIDAAVSITQVVDEILRQVEESIADPRRAPCSTHCA